METIRGVPAWGDPWGRSAQQGPRGGKINIFIYFLPSTHFKLLRQK